LSFKCQDCGPFPQCRPSRFASNGRHVVGDSACKESKPAKTSWFSASYPPGEHAAHSASPQKLKCMTDGICAGGAGVGDDCEWGRKLRTH
jgi:hypothetical protein